MSGPAYDPAAELVEVVDAEGRTIGVVPRREMRSRRLPHRCTWILVFNSQGELFIHLRTPTKDIFPSHWDVTVGGVLTAGESYDLGAQREVREELGVDVQLVRLFEFRHPADAFQALGVVYRASHDGPFALQREEIVRGEFVPLDALPSLTAQQPFCGEGLAVLAEYQRRIGRAPFTPSA